MSDDLKAFYQASQTFDGERAKAALASKRRAYWLAAGSLGVAAVSVMAIGLMMPLKTVEVRVFRVDSATGVVDLVSPLKGAVSYNEAITKYWLRAYVKARDGYMPDEAALAFRRVMLMSTDEQQVRHNAVATPRNPESLAATIGRSGRVDIDVKSITFPTAKLALVRYTRVVRKGTEVSPPTQWLATVSYEFVNSAMAESDREVNPLGFLVRDYRVDPENQ